VGMLLDPRFLLDHLGWILLLVVAVSLGKGLLFAGIARLFGYGNVVPLAVGLGLFQVGEFSFVLAREGMRAGSIGHELYTLVLTVAVMTMFLTPLVSGQTARLYALRRRWFRHEPLRTMNLPREGLHDHVVIAGAGRVGFQIAQVLAHLSRSFVLIEMDQRRVERAKEAGMPVIFGDATQEIVLEAARLKDACLLLVTSPGVIEARSIVQHARRLHPDLDLVVRTSDPDFVPALRELEVLEVVVPEYEAGLEMTRQALLHLGVPGLEIQRRTEALRDALLGTDPRPGDRQRILRQLRGADTTFDLEWIGVEADAPLVGASLGAARIRTVTGASVVGVLRPDGALEVNPGPEAQLGGGDLLAVLGRDAARQALKEMLQAKGG